MLTGLTQRDILLADRAYDSDELRRSAASRGAWANIKPMPNRVAAFGAAPIAFALMSISTTRRVGASTVLWIATVGLDDAALRNSFDEFAAEVAVGRGAVRWRREGLEALRRRLAAGDRVVIAAAARLWLAQALSMRIHLTVPIFGSSLTTLGDGWVGSVHSRHEQKCTLLTEAGHGSTWSTVYSDSADDGHFRAEDNLESPWASRALQAFYGALNWGTVEGWTIAQFEEKTGLSLTDRDGAVLASDKLPVITTWLNRILALRIADINHAKRIPLHPEGR